MLTICFAKKYRRNLNLWTSLAAMAAASSPMAAVAETISTAETGKVSLSGNGSLVVTSTGSLSTGGSKAVSISAPTATTVTVESGGIISSNDDAISGKSVTSGSGAITIVNNGAISSSVSGQAIDLNDVASADITTTIINAGIISSAGGDGIRPGANALVKNSGTIISDGPAGESFDGVDFQGYAGSIINEAGGLISGRRHGTTSDVDVNVVNQAGATIIGRNGSGVGSDGNGTVINYGTIIGAYDGSGTGDGDGVDVDGDFYIENYGTIESTGAGGVDKGGNNNVSEGLALSGSGTVINEAGASITAKYTGIALCCTGKVEITNRGEIHGDMIGIEESGIVSIYNDGRITGNYMGVKASIWVNDLYLSNNGYISGASYGVYIYEDAGYSRIENSGTIAGGVTAVHVGVRSELDLIGTDLSLVDGAFENHGSANVAGGRISGTLTNSGALAVTDMVLADLVNSAGTATLSGTAAGTVSNAAGATFSAVGGSIDSVLNAGTVTLGSGNAVTHDVFNNDGGALLLDGASVGGRVTNGGTLSATDAVLADLVNSAGTATLRGTTAGVVGNAAGATFSAVGGSIDSVLNAGTMTLGSGNAVTHEVFNNDGGALLLDGASVGGRITNGGTLSATDAVLADLVNSAGTATLSDTTAGVVGNAAGATISAVGGSIDNVFNAGTMTLGKGNTVTRDVRNIRGTLTLDGVSIGGTLINSGTLIFTDATVTNFFNSVDSSSLSGTPVRAMSNVADTTSPAANGSIANVFNVGTMTLGKGNFVTYDVRNLRGTLTLDGASIGGRLMIEGGLLRISEAGSTAGSLEGAAAGTLDGELTLIAANGTYSGSLAGLGGLTLVSGSEILTGVNTYSGATNVGGTLVVDGSIANSAATVGTGGTLAGSGTVGATYVLNGGVLAPAGDSALGTITINGDLKIAAGATLSAGGADAATGQAVTVNGLTYEVLAADHVRVAGATTLNGGTVVFNGALKYGQAYDLVTAAGGITGAFDDLVGVSSSYLFLSPTLLYSDNDAYVVLARNSVSFASVADSANRRATGLALDGLPPTSSVASVVVQMDAAGARTAFDALSGEVHASAMAAMTEDSIYYRQAALDRLAVGQHGLVDLDRNATNKSALWGAAYTNAGHSTSDGNAARLKRSLSGFMIGVDTPLSAGWSVGGLFAYDRSKIDVGSGRASSGKSDNFTLGAYAGAQFGAMRAGFGSSYTFHSLAVNRTVAFGDFSEALSSRYNANTAQVFGEVAYVFGARGWALAPFGNLAYVNAHIDGFAEKAGGSELIVEAADQHTTLSTVGMRGEAVISTGTTQITFDAMLGYRHVFGTGTPRINAAFAAGGSGMDIAGAPLSTNAAIAKAGMSFRPREWMSLSLSYVGQYGNRSTDTGVRGQLSIGF